MLRVLSRFRLSAGDSRVRKVPLRKSLTISEIFYRHHNALQIKVRKLQ